VAGVRLGPDPPVPAGAATAAPRTAWTGHGGRRGDEVEPSERITWEDCPNCRRAAAVGWADGQPVEFDCPRGCHLGAEQVRAFTAVGGSRSPVEPGHH
jgi:hypothetical protein